MYSLRWRWFRMSMARKAFQLCPIRFQSRLFDVLEAIKFLDVDHLEDVANDFPAIYNPGEEI